MTFKRFSKLEYTNFLAQFLPDGVLFSAKFIDETILRKWLQGIAVETKRLGDAFVDYVEQLDPSETEYFLSEWESAIKIPDDCIPVGSTIQERRDNIILKLTSLAVQTDQDFIDLAANFGFTITIDYVDDIYPPYDVPFIPYTEPEHKFVWVITGNFASDLTKAQILQCLILKLTASNTKVIFQQS